MLAERVVRDSTFITAAGVSAGTIVGVYCRVRDDAVVEAARPALIQMSILLPLASGLAYVD